MDEIPAERRLVAILAADIVGYSRLIEEDEAATLTAIRTLRHEALDPLLAQHHGRIVKLTGDGAIVEFGSVVDAVNTAVAIQQETAARQSEVPPEASYYLPAGRQYRRRGGGGGRPFRRRRQHRGGSSSFANRAGS